MRKISILVSSLPHIKPINIQRFLAANGDPRGYAPCPLRYYPSKHHLHVGPTPNSSLPSGLM
jgi:hypothetical protein